MSEAEIENYKAKRATFVDKLKRLESGEMNCEVHPKDGRQQEAISRTKRGIAAIDHELKKATK